MYDSEKHENSIVFGNQTKLFSFMQIINKKYQVNLKNYDDLWKWSVEFYKDFWLEMWIFTPIIYSKTFSEVVDENQMISDIPIWFKEAKLNYAENMLRFRDNKTALISTGEGRTTLKLSYSELYHEVCSYTSSLRKLNVKVGDRVAGYISNSIEAVVAMLATASIGAIWSSTSPDFGSKGVLDRFCQIKPKVMFSVNAVRYNNKVHDHWNKLRSVVDELDELEAVIVIPFTNSTDFNQQLELIPKSMSLDEFKDLDKDENELKFEQLPFNHPLFIMYSSGTTGKPKCLVHSTGGTLIQHAKEHLLHGDMRRDDVFIYYTNTGWMMWNWLVGALVTGCSLVLYDGSPFQPTPLILWDLVDTLKITVLGVSAKSLAVMEEKKMKPKSSHDLHTLRTILSTGSPLAPHQYDFVYSNIKSDVLLASITGGTDIISCFAGHNPMKSVTRGEIQSANLAMAIRCYDNDGNHVTDEAGELVCTKPFPSMPTYFWNDDKDKSLYKSAYFHKFPDAWCHGDYCMQMSSTKGWKMLGRSDATLNPNGIRIGTSEIYSIIESNFGGSEIRDSVAAAYRKKDCEEEMLLFVVLYDGVELDNDLKKRICSKIRSGLSPRHTPTIIKSVPDIPYTISGKKVEVAITKILAGVPVLHLSVLRNPESLEAFKHIMS